MRSVYSYGTGVLFVLVCMAWVALDHETEGGLDLSLDSAAPIVTVSIDPTGPGQTNAPALALPVTPSLLTGAEEQNWRVRLPNKQTLFGEALLDVHSTPKSLLKVAQIFSETLADAKDSPAKAKAAFAKFRLCAEDIDNQYVTSLRALCYTNAQEIARIYPSELNSDLESIRNNVDAKTAGLLDSYSRL